MMADMESSPDVTGDDVRLMDATDDAMIQDDAVDVDVDVDINDDDDDGGGGGDADDDDDDDSYSYSYSYHDSDDVDDVDDDDDSIRSDDGVRILNQETKKADAKTLLLDFVLESDDDGLCRRRRRRPIPPPGPGPPAMAAEGAEAEESGATRGGGFGGGGGGGIRTSSSDSESSWSLVSKRRGDDSVTVQSWEILSGVGVGVGPGAGTSAGVGVGAGAPTCHANPSSDDPREMDGIATMEIQLENLECMIRRGLNLDDVDGDDDLSVDDLSTIYTSIFADSDVVACLTCTYPNAVVKNSSSSYSFSSSSSYSIHSHHHHHRGKDPPPPPPPPPCCVRCGKALLVNPFPSLKALLSATALRKRQNDTKIVAHVAKLSQILEECGAEDDEDDDHHPYRDRARAKRLRKERHDATQTAFDFCQELLSMDIPSSILGMSSSSSSSSSKIEAWSSKIKRSMKSAREKIFELASDFAAKQSMLNRKNKNKGNRHDHHHKRAVLRYYVHVSPPLPKKKNHHHHASSKKKRRRRDCDHHEDGNDERDENNNDDDDDDRHDGADYVELLRQLEASWKRAVEVPPYIRVTSREALHNADTTTDADTTNETNANANDKKNRKKNATIAAAGRVVVFLVAVLPFRQTVPPNNDRSAIMGNHDNNRNDDDEEEATTTTTTEAMSLKSRDRCLPILCIPWDLFHSNPSEVITLERQCQTFIETVFNQKREKDEDDDDDDDGGRGEGNDATAVSHGANNNNCDDDDDDGGYEKFCSDHDLTVDSDEFWAIRELQNRVASKTLSVLAKDDHASGTNCGIKIVDGHVRQLSLSRLGLTSIPHCVQRFCHLNYLNLSHNRLTTFPPPLERFRDRAVILLNGNPLRSAAELLSCPRERNAVRDLESILGRALPVVSDLRPSPSSSVSSSSKERGNGKKRKTTSPRRRVAVAISGGGNVVGIELNSRGLSDLPTSMEDLIHLTYLGLSHNRFESVPPVVRILNGRVCNRRGMRTHVSFVGNPCFLASTPGIIRDADEHRALCDLERHIGRSVPLFDEYDYYHDDDEVASSTSVVGAKVWAGRVVSLVLRDLGLVTLPDSFHCLVNESLSRLDMEGNDRLQLPPSVHSKLRRKKRSYDGGGYSFALYGVSLS